MRMLEMRKEGEFKEFVVLKLIKMEIQYMKILGNMLF